ncbi:MAG: hypothetical protein PHY73_00795 [Candidatus Omnitrophica bacterium]|nr:hypothetical protein [Candidatus Omnitrophota bacterium]
MFKLLELVYTSFNLQLKISRIIIAAIKIAQRTGDKPLLKRTITPVDKAIAMQSCKSHFLARAAPHFSHFM